MYTVSTTPDGHDETATTIPGALAVLGAQLTTHLPDGPVTWTITDPTGTEHRGNNALNGRLDRLTIVVDELLEDLYTQLHRAADGGPHAERIQQHGGGGVATQAQDVAKPGGTA